MNIFKILKIKKSIKDAQNDPNAFAKDQVRGILWGLVILPLLISTIVVILFFIIGYTELFGFQVGFFKFLFWISFAFILLIFSLIRRITRHVSKITFNQNRKIINAVVVDPENKTNSLN